jgi:hypothetical protein
MLWCDYCKLPLTLRYHCDTIKTGKVDSVEQYSFTNPIDFFDKGLIFKPEGEESDEEGPED